MAKKIVITKIGSPDVLQYIEYDIPSKLDQDALIRVHQELSECDADDFPQVQKVFGNIKNI